MSLSQLKQLYYNLHISSYFVCHISMGWYLSIADQQSPTKQNTVIRVMFFAVTHGKEQRKRSFSHESTQRVVSEICPPATGTKKELPSIFQNYFQYADQVRNYNTRYAPKKNFYKPRTRTNIGKQSIQSIAVDLGKDLPLHLKDLPNYSFPRILKHHLLIRQFESWPYSFFSTSILLVFT